MATAASVNNSNQLVIYNGLQVVDTVGLSGSYTNISFATRSDGKGGTFITQQTAPTSGNVANFLTNVSIIGSNSYTITDTSTNIVANLTTLQTNLAKIASIIQSNFPVALLVTAAQSPANNGVLAKIAGDYNLTVTGTSAVETLYDTVNSHAAFTGGAGIDTFMVTGTDTITDLGNGGADVLKVSASAIVNATVTAAWTATATTTNSGTANLTTNGLAVNLALVTTGTNGYKVTNTGVATTLTGSALADTLIGGTGADSLIGGLGNDSLTGGTGLDTFTVAIGTDTISDLGAGGADVLKVSASAIVNATVTAAWTATATTTNSGTANLTTNGLAVNLALVTTGTNGYKVTNTGVATTLTGSALADTLIGGTGADSLLGGAGADIVNGGKGQDNLTGGAGRDTFIFAAGDDGITAATLDKILDYAKGAVGTGDLIDYSANLTKGGNANTATASQASINSTTGIATFASGSGTTLADALNDIAARFTAATNTAGEFAFFKVNGSGDYYLFISDGTAGAAANDDVIQLVGITSIGTIDLTGGNLTITG